MHLGSSVAMPSDLAKKKAAKKKEAAKARQRTKKPEEINGVNGEGEKPESQENGAADDGKTFTCCLALGLHQVRLRNAYSINVEQLFYIGIRMPSPAMLDPCHL